jgi:type II secretory pathway predicted ATPase ExeA
VFRQYFGLTHDPFCREVATRDLYPSADLRELDSRLSCMLRSRGMFLLTAEPGCGKTTALRRFTAGLNPSVHRPVYIALSTVTVMDFYRGILIGLGGEAGHNKVAMFQQIQQLIESSHYEQKLTPVLVFDEAQCLSGAVLDDIRMILNFRMDSESPYVCILAGQQSVRRRLQLAANRALRQRFLGNYHMSGIAKDEVAGYISSRLSAAGAATPQDIFMPAALECLHAASSGLPRVLNSLAAASLTLAAATDRRTVDEEVVYQAEKDVEI